MSVYVRLPSARLSGLDLVDLYPELSLAHAREHRFHRRGLRRALVDAALHAGRRRG